MHKLQLNDTPSLTNHCFKLDLALYVASVSKPVPSWFYLLDQVRLRHPATDANRASLRVEQPSSRRSVSCQTISGLGNHRRHRLGEG
jgi:hypothetical protein